MLNAALLSVLLAMSAGSVQGSGSASAATIGSQTANGETRTVALEIREGERLIGQPTLTVRLGAPASIAVSGDGGYKLDLTVEQLSPGALYLVRTHLHRPDGDGWALVASPSMTVAEGQQTSMVITRTPAPYALSVSVR